MQSKKTHNYSVFVSWLVAVSAVIGAGFGFWGQQIYGGEMAPKHSDLPIWIGIGWGLLLGAATGWLYGMAMDGIRKAFKSNAGIILFGTILGMIAAAVCSTVFHALLRSLFNSNSFPMFISGIFNIAVGLVLGIIFSSVVAIKYKKSQ